MIVKKVTQKNLNLYMKLQLKIYLHIVKKHLLANTKNMQPKMIFIISALPQDITPPQALMGMMAKHTISVYDAVNDDAQGIEISIDYWREKIGDNINYLLILWAMISLDKMR